MVGPMAPPPTHTMESVEMSHDALDKAFREAVGYVRSRLGEANIGRFRFEITSSGQTQTGANNVKIEYFVDGDYSDTAVRGNSLDAVVTELMRRRGWNVEHAPLQLASEAK